MLKHLSITNYAIIENVELKFKNGFTVITGETGAGKSILLDALSLILGKRADTTVLNNKQKKCIVEGEFHFSKEIYLNFFKSNDLDYEKINIIRREINSIGKSRAFINDTPVSLSILRELTIKLIDIHSQHQTLQIKDSKFQINLVDVFAGIKDQRINYYNQYTEYKNRTNQLNNLIGMANKAKTDIDYINFQVQEIEELNIKPGEKEKIESDLKIVNNIEEIKTVLENSLNRLNNSDQNVLSTLKDIQNSYTRIKDCSDAYSSIYKRMNSILIELDDIAREIDNKNSGLNFSSDNLANLNNRLSMIFSIEQKHNVSTSEEILKILEKLKIQQNDCNSFEEKIRNLTNLVKKDENELLKLAKLLSKKRRESFKGLNNKIEVILGQLGMQDASFEIKHNQLENLNDSGLDKIDFLFSSNKGYLAKELSQIASGGELSRLMLAIKSILSINKELPSIIFDEIDTGVSGDVADKMANMMKEMSKEMQVIAITHLPQVAAKGDMHYKIYKENKKGKSLTGLLVLNKIDRVEELAKMLSGNELTDEARANAKILLNM